MAIENIVGLLFAGEVLTLSLIQLVFEVVVTVHVEIGSGLVG